MTPDELKAIRKAAGLTQAEFGKRVRKNSDKDGVSRLTVANWESGKYRIPADLADQLAAAGLQKEAQEPGKTPAKQRKYDEMVLAEYRTWRSNPINPEFSEPTPNGCHSHKSVYESMVKRGYVFSHEVQLIILQEYPELSQTTN